MSVSLTQCYNDFQTNVQKVMCKDFTDFNAWMNELARVVNEGICSLIAGRLNDMDQAIQEDPIIKKKYHIQHKGRERSFLTRFGQVTFSRTHYQHRKTGKNEYLVDTYIRLNRYQRVSDDLMIKLAETAVETPYRRASEYVTGGQVSPQTVMRALRNTEPEEATYPKTKRVPVIHMDADEDHVVVRRPKAKAQRENVKLAVSYEGIKDGACISSQATGRYGVTSDDFWEEVLTELDAKYDLSDTKVYLHADGASWIAKAREYLPNCTFILDPYHANKHITMIRGFLKKTEDYRIGELIGQVLYDGRKDIMEYMAKYVRNKYKKTLPSTVSDAFTYLLNNIDGISIRKNDAEAKHGGCSEPHVSNILSRRLSSRPCAWSPETLDALVPMLAAKRKLKVRRKKEKLPVMVRRAVRKDTKRYVFDMQPEAVGNVPAISIGECNAVYNSLRWILN